MIDDLLLVLYAHPQVYVDVGIIIYSRPRRGSRINCLVVLVFFGLRDKQSEARWRG